MRFQSMAPMRAFALAMGQAANANGIVACSAMTASCCGSGTADIEGAGM
jgi:hypothetical protein